MKTILIITIILLSFCLSVYSFVYAGSGHGLSADNSSIATVVNKVDNTFNITGGTVKTNNLFHSFSNFNLETQEIADFQGNAGIANIISRVTGANDSWINGKIKSSIAGANLYLLNPNGIMFGPGASLDITGSFHVSTADYLKFGDGNILYADLGSESVLTSVPVEVFGFLGDSVGTITFDGADLSVSEGKNISVIGKIYKEVEAKGPGDVNVQVDISHTYDKDLDVFLINPSGTKVELFSDIGGSRSNFTNTILDDEADISIKHGIAPFTGTYRPEGTLADFDIEDPNGEWILEITDDAKGDEGTLNNWSLTLNDSFQFLSTDIPKDVSSDFPTTFSSLTVEGFEPVSTGIMIARGISNSNLKAPGGYLNLISVASEGKVSLTDSGLASNAEQSGDIAIRNSTINVNNTETGSTAGQIFIQGNDVTLDKSELLAKNHSDQNTGTASIDIKADNLEFNNSKITVSSTGTGTAGGIDIDTSNDFLLSESTLKIEAAQSNGGNINVQADFMEFTNSSIATKIALDGGNINLTANQDIIRNNTPITTQVGGTGGIKTFTPGLYSSSSLIILDGSFGTEGELSGCPDYFIDADLGSQVGTNLFHSFTEFNIGSGEIVTFTGSTDIRNIINRVTGGNNSSIDGILKTSISGADLYFFNPNGIIFGPNSSLDITGSFYAATANYLIFENNDIFYAASSPNVLPASNPDDIFGFSNTDVGSISFDDADLSVLESKNFSLIGGQITAAYSNLNAPGGHLNLVSMASEGEAELTQSGTDISIAHLGDITISNSNLNTNNTVQSTTAGQIFIRSDNFVIKNKSSVLSDNYSEQDASDISIDIKANKIQCTEGAFISASTYGHGNSGDMILNIAETLNFSGESNDAFSNHIRVASGYLDCDGSEITGDAGLLQINAKDISFTDGAYINSSTYGQGKGGDVVLNAENSLSFAGGASDGWSSSSAIKIITDYEGAGAGDAGSLEINAKDISFINGAYINSTTYGQGKGGDIVLNAENSLSFAGEASNGDGGSAIQITTNYEGAGAGDAGSLEINAKDILFSHGAWIYSRTHGQGKGGQIFLNAENSVSFSGIGAEGSRISSSTYYKGSGAGDAGLLSIKAKDILFTHGAWIYSRAYGQGKGGQIFLNAENSVNFSGIGFFGEGSWISFSTRYEESNAGDAGSVSIKAKEILFKDGAFVDGETTGKGNAGNIILIAENSIELSGMGSALNAKPIPTVQSGASDASTGGSGGNVYLNASEIILKKGAAISAGTDYTGEITDNAYKGAGGSIQIIADSLILEDGSKITASTTGTAQGGNIIIGDISELQEYENELAQKYGEDYAPEFWNDFFNKVRANGITETGNLSLMANSSIASESTSGENAGQAGNIEITTTDSVTLKSGSSITTESKNAGGGGIDVKTINKLYLLNSEISTSTNSQSSDDRGGDIFIDPVFVVLNNSKIKANAWGGPGGNINIIADYFMPSSDSIIQASSQQSTPGEIKIQAVEIDIAGALNTMDTKLLDATKWQKTPCSLRSAENMSRLIVEGRDATPAPVDDFLSGLNSILSDEYFFRPDNNPERYKAINPKLFEELFADKMADTCDKNAKCTNRGRCK